MASEPIVLPPEVHALLGNRQDSELTAKEYSVSQFRVFKAPTKRNSSAFKA